MNAIVRGVRAWFAIPLMLRVAIGLWLALFFGVLGRVVFSPVTSQSVVPIYLGAGERWLEAKPLYGVVCDDDLFRNPPGFALLFSGVTSAPPKLVAIVWRMIGIGIFLWGLVQWRRILGSSKSGWSLSVAALLILPSFNNGQVNLHVVGCVLCGMSAAAYKRWWLASAWLTAGIALKLYPIAAAGLAFVVQPRKLFPRLLVLSAAAFAVPFLFQEPLYVVYQHEEFITCAMEDDRTHAIPDRVPRDWTIIPHLYFDVIASQETELVVSIVSGLLMAGLVWFRRTEGFALPLALALIWMTLFGPATESNTYSLLAPLAFLLDRPMRRWQKFATIIAVVLLGYSVIRGSAPKQWGYNPATSQPIAATLLLLVVLTRGCVGWDQLDGKRNTSSDELETPAAAEAD